MAKPVVEGVPHGASGSRPSPRFGRPGGGALIATAANPSVRPEGDSAMSRFTLFSWLPCGQRRLLPSSRQARRRRSSAARYVPPFLVKHLFCGLMALGLFLGIAGQAAGQPTYVFTTL